MADPRLANAPEVERLESDELRWLVTLWPSMFNDATGTPIPIADEHRDFWSWLWDIKVGVRPEAYIGIWPRGRGKSSNAERAVVALGSLNLRPYGWYVSATQDLADGHVADGVGEALGSPALASFYPDMADRAVGRFGESKGWRRNRLRTRSGFAVDALGLDVAARGKKLGDARPSFIILDDLDDALDSPGATAKKLDIVRTKIIPAGDINSLVVIAIQNLVHPASIFSALASMGNYAADSEAAQNPEMRDFLRRRRISFVQCVRGLEYEFDERSEAYRIVRGEATWAGQDLGAVEDLINDIGPTAFEREYQHDVRPPAGGIFSHIKFRDLLVDKPLEELLRELDRVVVWVDPAVTSKDSSDAQAVVAMGVYPDGRVIILYAWEQIASPREALERALVIAARFRAQHIGIETDQGGDTWTDVYKNARENLLDGDSELLDELLAIPGGAGWVNDQLTTHEEAKAGQGQIPKVARIQQMVGPMETRQILFWDNPTYLVAREAYWRFPKTKPFDFADASYWGWVDLTQSPEVAAAPQPPPPEEDPYAAERRSTIFSSAPPPMRRGRR